MTQTFDKQLLTRAFVDMKTAVQDALKLGLKEYTAAGVIDWRVKVLKADPQGPGNIPCIAISRTSDSEVNQVLGDLFAYDNDSEIDSVIKKFGTDFRETMELRIRTSNSDQRDLLYALTKAILFNYRHFLALKYGLVNQQIIGGRDEANHVQYESHFMYWGVVIFQAENAIQRNLIGPRLHAVESRLNLVSEPYSSPYSDSSLNDI